MPEPAPQHAPQPAAGCQDQPPPDPRAVAERLDLALQAARAAGAVAMQHFQSDDLRIQTKPDGSPVTQADTAAESVLRAAIEEAFPHDEILGEEMGLRPGAAAGGGYRWILDPIDGTVSFLHGVPLFGTLVGVFRGDRPVAGVVHMPALHETVYAGLGLGAWWIPGSGQDPRPGRLSRTDRLDQATVLATGPEYFRQAGHEGLESRLARAVGRLRGWSDCYAHVLLATGRCDAVVEPVVKPWDLAPMACILAELGGHLVDWHGRPGIDAGQAIATNASLARPLLAWLAEHAPGDGPAGDASADDAS